MFEISDMNFMNPYDREIMQHNLFWKWIFVCLDFAIATQQNIVGYTEKTFLEKINTSFKRKQFSCFPPTV